VLEGVDKVSGQPMEANLGFAVRFHLHHAVLPRTTGEQDVVDLALPDGSYWQFEADCPVDIEESVHLSDVFGSRATRQLVLGADVASGEAVKWRLSAKK